MTRSSRGAVHRGEREGRLPGCLRSRPELVQGISRAARAGPRSSLDFCRSSSRVRLTCATASRCTGASSAGCTRPLRPAGRQEVGLDGRRRDGHYHPHSDSAIYGARRMAQPSRCATRTARATSARSTTTRPPRCATPAPRADRDRAPARHRREHCRLRAELRRVAAAVRAAVPLRPARQRLYGDRGLWRRLPHTTSARRSTRFSRHDPKRLMKRQGPTSPPARSSWAAAGSATPIAPGAAGSSCALALTSRSCAAAVRRSS